MKQSKLKLVQIHIAPYSNEMGQQNYSVIGLDTKGHVWRYEHNKGGWVPYNMATV